MYFVTSIHLVHALSRWRHLLHEMIADSSIWYTAHVSRRLGEAHQGPVLLRATSNQDGSILIQALCVFDGTHG